MATLGGYYLNPHDTQFDGSTYEDENCTPTAGDNGANASTGGKVNKSGASIRALIPRSQETNPQTPGWSLEDLDHAMAKINVPFAVKSGEGWGQVITYLGQGHYVVLQGDSDQFSNNTCSGRFNGDHCIGIHPATRMVGGLRQHWINDGICKVGRWEFDYILRRYAVKLSANIRFGIFTAKVPRTVVASPAPTPVTLRYGAVKITKATKVIRVAVGQKANVRTRPTTAASIAARLPNGATFTVYQRTSHGEALNPGGSIWYANAAGTRWLHITAF